MPDPRDSRSVRHDTALRIVQEVEVADLLDQATKRLASTLDVSDTDEGMESVQTRINQRFLDAIADEWFGGRDRAEACAELRI